MIPVENVTGDFLLTTNRLRNLKTATAISKTAIEGTKKNAFSIASRHLAHVSLLVRDAEGKMTDRNAVIAVGIDANFSQGRSAPDKNNAEQSISY